MKTLIYGLSISFLLILLYACSSGGGSSSTTAYGSSNWDELQWDRDNWR